MQNRNSPTPRPHRRLKRAVSGALVSSFIAASTLNAVTHYDIYLVGGQSNMDGRGRVNELKNDLESWRKPQPDVRIFYANPKLQRRTSGTESPSSWQILAPGFSVPPNYTNALPSGTFGPELSFARSLADAHPGQHLALIKVTEGGTSLRKDWTPNGGRLYRTFTNTVQEALGQLKTNGDTFTLRGMIWHQGEADISAGGATYVTNLTNFIHCVRRDVGSPQLPFVLGEVATNYPSVFRHAQASATNVLSGVGFASSDALATMEGVHFRTPDVLELGRRYARALTPLLSAESPADSHATRPPAGR